MDTAREEEQFSYIYKMHFTFESYEMKVQILPVLNFIFLFFPSESSPFILLLQYYSKPTVLDWIELRRQRQSIADP